MKGLQYIDNYPWEIRGIAHIYDKDEGLIIDKDAGIRFGEHYYMQGFRICLATRFQNDDKHEFYDTIACWRSKVIMGIASSTAVVFIINDGQLEKLKKYAKNKYTTKNINVLVGAIINGMHNKKK